MLTRTANGPGRLRAVGPGRSLGVVKPDLMAFGGDPAKHSYVSTPGAMPTLGPQPGTSLAAPYLLRSAVGIRAVLGADLSPPGIRALLVPAADPSGHDESEEGFLAAGCGSLPQLPARKEGDEVGGGGDCERCRLALWRPPNL